MGRRAVEHRLMLSIVVLVAVAGAGSSQEGSADLPRARAVWANPALRDLAIACADICGKALTAYEQASGVEGPENVVVQVHGPPATGFPSTCAAAPDSIYVNAAGWEIGQRYRPRAGAVGLLCQAAAELLDLGEIPGFAYYAAHVHGVPAVCGDTPPMWQGAPYAVGNEGQTMLAALRDNAALLEQHPNWAAASLLWRLEEKAGEAATLCRALADAEGSGHDRLVAVAGREEYAGAEVAGALATYQTAQKPLTDAPQTLTISSFERPADLAKWQKWGLELIPAQESVADGESAAEISYPAKPDGFLTLCLMDADWYAADWSRYDFLSAQVHNLMPFRVGLMVELFDAPDRGRCVARCQTTIGGGYQGPWVVPLERLWERAEPYEDSVLPPAAFDKRTVAQLCLTIPKPLAAGRVRIDALQLQRSVGGASD